jgi:hypothetical protein
VGAERTTADCPAGTVRRATDPPLTDAAAGTKISYFRAERICAVPFDAAATVRQSNEVGRITEDLSERFPQYQAETVEALVRAEFGRRSSAPVQDFVPVFVERALRARLHAH